MKNKTWFLVVFLLVVGVLARPAEMLEASSVYEFDFTGPMKYEDMVEEIEKIQNLNLVSLSIEVSEIGESVEGKPLYLLKIRDRRSKDNLEILVISQQHGNEPAGTTGIFSLISDLVKDYARPGEKKLDLTGITLLFVPMVNPDGTNYNSRNNANDQNINRDWLKKQEPETVAVFSVFQEYEPEIFIDLHEFTAFPYRSDFDLTYYPGYDDSSPEELRKLHEDFETKLDPIIEAKEYPCEKISPRMETWTPGDKRLAGNYFALEHFAVSYIVESKGMPGGARVPSLSTRAEMHKTFMEAMIEFAADNRERIQQVVSSLR